MFRVRVSEAESIRELTTSGTVHYIGEDYQPICSIHNVEKNRDSYMRFISVVGIFAVLVIEPRKGAKKLWSHF